MTNNTKTMIARVICSQGKRGYCDCVGASDGCKVGRGESYDGSNCKMTSEAMPMSTEWQTAQAVLNAISEAGMVIVPVEPTPDMLIAMEAALNYQGVDNVEVTDGLEAYRAAIKAGNK